MCNRFATAGFNTNMIAYLTQQLHLPLVAASNLLTNFTGTADSFAGHLWTTAAPGVLSQLGMLGLVVSALVPAPPHAVQRCRRRPLICDVCRGETAKEICLFPDHPCCPHRLDRMAFVMCYPTCAASGHMVRKCKDCGALGSVSLIPGKGKALTPDSKNMVMLIHCDGYIPIAFSPAPYWIATKVNGDQHELRFSEDGFEGYGDNDELILTSAKFTVERLKKAEEKHKNGHLIRPQEKDRNSRRDKNSKDSQKIIKVVESEEEAGRVLSVGSRKGARESGQSGLGQIGRRKAWPATA
uniref:Uncharacterized protein n=1 Tax=Oryza glumipatula TaxID=40148 RepID=A0A0E0ACH9_9ORYZ